MKKSELVKISLTSSVLTTIYIAVVAYLMQNGEKFFGKMDNWLGPVAFLLLFVLSAAVVGWLILGKPITWYLNGKKNEAILLFKYTIGWLFLLTIVALVIQMFI
jgi:SNF family Na+-dependent transporter